MCFTLHPLDFPFQDFPKESLLERFGCSAGIANYLSGNHPGAVSMCYNGFSKALTAAVLFKASGSFDKAVTMPGCNVSNLLSAIGPKGLTMLWHQLTVFAWTVALSQVHPSSL